MRKTNNTLARKFGNVFRFIDDLLALNDGKSFESYYHDIYPAELQLNKENEVDNETNFLDLLITGPSTITSSTLCCMTNEMILVSMLLDSHTRRVIFHPGCFIQVSLPNACVSVDPLQL